MLNIELKDLTLGESVKKYPKLSKFFNENKIDYCCGGDNLISDELKEFGDIDLSKYLNNDKIEVINYDDLNNEELIDYIIKTHHVIELDLLEEIDGLIKKVLFVHYKSDPILISKIHKNFSTLKMELEEHFSKEENILFPLIINEKDKSKLINEIEIIESEHDVAGDLIKEMYSITNNFELPEFSCNTYELMYLKLESLFEDIFEHIHKENSILFKRFEDELSLEERKNIIKNLLLSLHEGVDKEKVRLEFIDKLGDISSEEIAEAEKELIAEGTEVEEIQKLCDIHASIFEDNIKNKTSVDKSVEEGHPVFVLVSENKGITEYLDLNLKPTFDNYLNNKNDNKIKNDLLEQIRKIRKIDNHYKRKEILLFPYLEKNNITAPPKVMWAVDDEIRDLIKLSEYFLINEEMEIDDMLDEAIIKIEGMIVKENTILIPLLLDNISDAEWVLIAKESENVGYAFNDNINGASLSDIRTWINANDGGDVVEKYIKGEVNLPSGSLELKELELMLNKLPIDITFVDKDGFVKYFSENSNRIFPRTRTIIGREVKNCHPKKSLDIVEQIIEDFKNGVKDEEIFHIEKGDNFIVIRYYAVRDVEKEYIGVLEVTEEVSDIRKLKGSKTLLS